MHGAVESSASNSRSKSVLAYGGCAKLLGLRGTRTYRRRGTGSSIDAGARRAGRRGEASSLKGVWPKGPQESRLQEAKAQGVVAISEYCCCWCARTTGGCQGVA